MVASITEYVSYFEAGEDMTDEEYGIYMRAVHNFAYKDIEPDYTKLPPLVKAALRTVIASVRKNKEDRENGAKGGRPAKQVITQEKPEITVTEKPRLFEEENSGFIKSETNEKENGNEKVKVNTHTESEEEPAENACVPAYISEPNKKINKDLAGTLLNTIVAHNSQTEKDRKVPVSNNIFTFSCKEMRELIAAVGPDETPGNILNALQNFLKVCKSDTWQKSHSWSTFCKHYTDYTPEFFTLERYLNDEPQTDDASKKPENAFFFAHKDDPWFHVETFQKHIDDWKAEGRPDGTDYVMLQDKWEAENAD